jgi:hypothetical protein
MLKGNAPLLTDPPLMGASFIRNEDHGMGAMQDLGLGFKIIYKDGKTLKGHFR